MGLAGPAWGPALGLANQGRRSSGWWGASGDDRCASLLACRVDRERIEAVGPDRAASEWLLRCGALVRYRGHDNWQQDYNGLPTGPLGKYKIQAIDATESCIMHKGFDYLGEWLRLCRRLSRFLEWPWRGDPQPPGVFAVSRVQGPSTPPMQHSSQKEEWPAEWPAEKTPGGHGRSGSLRSPPAEQQTMFTQREERVGAGYVPQVGVWRPRLYLKESAAGRASWNSGLFQFNVPLLRIQEVPFSNPWPAFIECN